MKNLYRITGKTIDGKLMFGGCFKAYHTYGVLLTLLFGQFKEDGGICDWVDFMEDALEEGFKPKKIYRLLEEPIRESYSTEFADEILLRLSVYLERFPNDRAGFAKYLGAQAPPAERQTYTDYLLKNDTKMVSK